MCCTNKGHWCERLFADNAVPSFPPEGPSSRLGTCARRRRTSRPPSPRRPVQRPSRPRRRRRKARRKRSPCRDGTAAGKESPRRRHLGVRVVGHRRRSKRSTNWTAHQAEVQRLKKILKEQQREIPDVVLRRSAPQIDRGRPHAHRRRRFVRAFTAITWVLVSPLLTVAQDGAVPRRHASSSRKTTASKSAKRLFREVRRFDAATAGRWTRGYDPPPRKSHGIRVPTA